MAKNRDFFDPEHVDEQIEQLSQSRLLQPPARSEAQLLHDLELHYQQEKDLDSRSLNRSLQRILAAEQQHHHDHSASQNRRIIQLQQFKTEPVPVPIPANQLPKRPRRQRLSVLAAVAIIAVLIGSMAAVAIIARHNTSGSASQGHSHAPQNHSHPSPQPTHAICSNMLTYPDVLALQLKRTHDQVDATLAFFKQVQATGTEAQIVDAQKAYNTTLSSYKFLQAVQNSLHDPQSANFKQYQPFIHLDNELGAAQAQLNSAKASGNAGQIATAQQAYNDLNAKANNIIQLEGEFLLAKMQVDATGAFLGQVQQTGNANQIAAAQLAYNNALSHYLALKALHSNLYPPAPANVSC